MTNPEAEAVPVLRVVSDLDNCKSALTPVLLAWSSERFGRAFTLEDFTERLALMWNVSRDDGRGHWDEFCQTVMPDLPLVDGMSDAVTGYPENVVEDLLTSRGVHLADITSAWAGQKTPHVRSVNHAGFDWRNDPDAHLKTKADSLARLGQDGPVHLFKDDEPKHTRGAVAKGIPAVVFGDYPWNRHARQDEGTRWIPTAALWCELIAEAASMHAAGQPIRSLFEPRKTIIS